MIYLFRVLVVCLSLASAYIPVESYFDSLETTSIKKQIVDQDEDFFTIAMVSKSFVEFDSDGEFFNHPFLKISLLPCLGFHLPAEPLHGKKQDLLGYTHLYLPPPV